jgi:epoxyqueuosine reductase QueG
MSLSIELKEYLQKNGATEVGFADITKFTPKEGLNSGVVFYITYPKEIIQNMENAPTLEYVLELVDLNTRLDALGMLCEEYLIDKGYDAYAQTKKRLGTDFGEFNSFELPHKTIATRAGLGWIGKSALFTTLKYGSALRLSSVLTNAPLDFGEPVLKIVKNQCDTHSQQHLNNDAEEGILNGNPKRMPKSRICQNVVPVPEPYYL